MKETGRAGSPELSSLTEKSLITGKIQGITSEFANN